jgi:hypothetical protein
MPDDDWDDDIIQARRAAANRQPASRQSGGPASIVGPNTIGMLALVDVGWSVWARDQGNIRHIRLDHRADARGGIVVEITTRRIADPDTGEFTDQRAFRCLDPYRCPQVHWTTLTETQVDPERVEGPETRRRWVAIFSLLDAARRPGKPMDLARTEHERTDRIGDAWRLARMTIR